MGVWKETITHVMSRRVVLLLAITVAVLGIVALPSAAGLTAEEAVTATDGESFAAAQVDCSNCHTDAPLSEGPENIETCAQCHDVSGEFQDSIHVAGEHADLNCTTCHSEPEDGGWFMHFRAGPHGDENPGVSMAPEDTCSQAGCHGYGSESQIPDGKESGVTHANAYHSEYGEWNETEDADWNSDMMSHSEPTESFVRTEDCMPCHGTHEGVFANIEEDRDIFEYAHDAQPNPENVTEWRVTCVACHEPHSIEEGDVVRGHFEDQSELCGQCHNAELGSELHADGHTEIHHSMWEMYSRSKFADNSSSHPELDCSSCHMPQLDRPGHGPDAAPRKMGHEFEVNTTRLQMDRLWTEEYRKCNACHQDLEATIDEQAAITQSMLDTAKTMRGEANQTVYDLEYEDDEQIASTLEEGTFWMNFVGAAGSGIHNPEMATERLTGSIARFDQVKSMAYEKRLNEMSQEPQTTTTTESTETTEEPTEETTTETPGLGIGVAMIALLGAALLAVRRWT